MTAGWEAARPTGAGPEVDLTAPSNIDHTRHGSWCPEPALLRRINAHFCWLAVRTLTDLVDVAGRS